jgi:hypothetical protein
VNLRERRAIHESGHAVAAIMFGIPIIAVSIAADRPHLHRWHYHTRMRTSGWNAVTLCLAGPEAEREFCVPITDDSDL